MIHRIIEYYKHFLRQIRSIYYFSGIVSIIVIVIVTKLIEDACLKTLLPICIRWMYYQSVILLFYIILELFRDYHARHTNKNKRTKQQTLSSSLSIRVLQILIIISGMLFLPNRYIPIGPKTEGIGIVVDNTEWGLSKTGFSSNYVKIKIDEEDVCFWYNLYKSSKPLGNKCIVSIRRGLFGIRYVENVDFLVE